MVKHIQTIRLLLLTNCLIAFPHFVGLALKGLNNENKYLSSWNKQMRFMFVDHGMNTLMREG